MSTGYPPYGGGYGRGRGRGGGYGQGRGMGRGMGPGPFPQQVLEPIPPPPPGVLRVAASTDDGNGLNARISFRFARAPFLTIVDLKDGKAVDSRSIQNLLAAGARGVGVAVGQWLVSSGVRLVLAPHLGPNIMMVLSQAGVKVEMVPPGVTIEEALRRLRLVY
ncbi:hypothetical protein DRO58_07000 [Candidatus Bathyarchaeota archaeon]|nr:MAG: hypothetical protein DRO58_07000 [Candidatus Bathyarchaeota archaeon]